MPTPRREPWLIGTAVLVVTVVPTAFDGRLHTLGATAGQVCLLGAGLLLLLWRRHPLITVSGGGALILAGIACPIHPSNLTLLLCTALAVVAGQCFGGRSAWTSAAGVLAWMAAMYLVTGERDAGLVMFTVPGFVAGTALRLRRETSEELNLRAQELEAERQLFADLAVRNERARIAAELHDIIGHSLSVMVVQAAAGQRLLQQDSPVARKAGHDALTVVAESAKQGRDDLARLVDLLGGQEVTAPDLALMDEIVALASGSGLKVTCRFEGERDGVGAEAAAVAFRVARESMTNALRHAPGSSVQVIVRGSARELDVHVENDAPSAPVNRIVGSGSGLRGLRDLVEHRGGRLSAGPTPGGGWTVHAVVPDPI